MADELRSRQLLRSFARVGCNEPGPFPELYLDRGTPGSLLMAFPGTGNKGVTSTNGVVTAVVAVEPASAHSTVLREDAAMGQDGHACMASAETSRNSFSVAPLAA
jgi:hypothetical protein